MRESCAIAIALAACVYPAPEPTGLELSWRFLEGNLVDGEAALRVRSCDGVGVAAIELRVVDAEDDARDGLFRFDCDAGFQTNVQYQTEASDAFIRLGSGTYRIEMDEVIAGGEAEAIDEREIDVNRRGVTVERWQLTPPLLPWTVSLHGIDACESVALSLFYADVEAMLPEHVPDDPEDDAPVRYRQGLVSDRGLTISGETQPCDPALLGTHVIADVDRGAYTLEVVVDTRVCTLPITLSPEQTATTVDLATLPCHG